MAKIMLIGADKVKAQLRGKTLKGRGELTVRVGYGDLPYAIRQHEDLTLSHPNGGQAKFLEQPAREKRPEMRALIEKKLQQRRSLEDALRAAGKLLLEASQKLVPVDTGALKESGFVEVV